MLKKLRASIRILSYIMLSVICAPVQGILLISNPRASGRFPCIYHKICCTIFKIRIETTGTPNTRKPCIFMANHSSYLDIPALGSVIEGSFVAKSEVASWPVFGWLARLQNTLFIDRRPSRVGQTQSALTNRLRRGHNLILFPEGTSSDGVRVLPFRHALFQSVINEAHRIPTLTVQPVTVICIGMNGFPADRTARQKYAWFGDMTLISHLWKFAQLNSCTLRISFHEPIDLHQIHDRKTFARSVEHTVAEGIPTTA